jgi:hypothetical protein
VNPELTPAVWRKSTRSANNGQCVEVAPLSDRVAMRDSKNPTGSVLVFSRGSWTAFVTGVSRGEFDPDPYT